MKCYFLGLLGILLTGCASQPAKVTESDSLRRNFELAKKYESVAGLGKVLMVVRAGSYTATFKDAEGVYYLQTDALEGIYLTKNYAEAWIFWIAHKPDGGGVFPYNTLSPVAELLFPPGGTVKARRLKSDFVQKLSWK